MNGTMNPYKGLRVEFHILQSFPVTCLNRDDVGAPKTAQVGGSTRARVSSQCWKRQVRLAMHELGINLGTRTKLISMLIKQACIDQGALSEQALACGNKVEQIFIKKSEEKKRKKDEDALDENHENESDRTDTLIFLGPDEVKLLASTFKKNAFDPEAVITQVKSDKQAKEIAEIIGKPNYSLDGLDIALFGRMVAQAASMNVDAATSFSHAISTHKVTNEVEIYTLDDLQTEPGSAHMGSLEFNSATYYRYISLDVGQLFQTLNGDEYFDKAIEAFVKALYLAVPSARQTTQSGASAWEFAKIMVRKGQRLQVPFETAVKAKDGGFLRPSIDELSQYIEKKEKLSGSLFGKVASWDFGEDLKLNIDSLIVNIQKAIKV